MPVRRAANFFFIIKPPISGYVFVYALSIIGSCDKTVTEIIYFFFMENRYNKQGEEARLCGF